MIDFLSDACDFAVRPELSNDVLVEAALAELSVLVNLFLRVLHDVLQAQWTELVPLVLGSLERNSVGILRPHVVERIFVSRRLVCWSLGLHNSGRRLLTAAHLIGLWKRLRCLVWLNSCKESVFTSSMLPSWNLPEIKLLEEVDLIVGINKLREHLSIVSEIVDQELERLAITIKEDFLINFLQFMQAVEHLLESRARHESQHISLGHHMVRSTNVQGYNLAVELDHRGDLCLVLLPLISLLLNGSVLLLEFLLHMHVVPLEELVVRNQLISDLVVLKCPLIEEVIDPGNVVSEDLLELLDARSPDALHLADARHSIDFNCLR